MPSNPITRRGFLGTSLSLSLAGTSGVLASETTKSAGRNELSWKDNQVIQNDRQAALHMLKPSRKELEHGLELHADSLVFDAYGFSPRAAVDGDAIRAAMEAGASKIELEDMREDMSMTRCVTDPVERAEFKQAWKAAGVTCIFQNAGEEGQDPMRLIKRLARFTFVTDMMRDFVPKAATPDDIVAAKKENRHCLYFTGNGVPLRQHWVSVEDELRYIRIFFQLGIRMMHLTYQRRNMIGDGCGETSRRRAERFRPGRGRGDEPRGRDRRRGPQRLANQPGGGQGLPAPMVASHTTCAALNKHIRSKPDEVIRAIATRAVRGHLFAGPVTWAAGATSLRCWTTSTTWPRSSASITWASARMWPTSREMHKRRTRRSSNVPSIARTSARFGRRTLLSPSLLGPRDPRGPSAPDRRCGRWPGPTGRCSRSAWSNAATRMMTSGRLSAATCSAWHAPR